MKKRMNDIQAIRDELYGFLCTNSNFWANNPDVELEPSIAQNGKPSEWSLSFANKDLKDVFRIVDPCFNEKVSEAATGLERTKIYRLHSSSLAPLLLFHKVSSKNPIRFKLGECWIPFNECHFECENQVSIEDDKTFSHIDIELISEDKKTILFLESKFSEYLFPKNEEYSWTAYYERMYTVLLDTLSDIGLAYSNGMKREKDKKTQEYKEKRVFYLKSLNSEKIYCEGIKQMICHYMGIQTEIDKKTYSGQRIYLGEILFDFRPSVRCAEDRLSSYSKAHCILVKALQKLAKDRFYLTSLMTYQEILLAKENKSYLESLEPNIRNYYKL